MANITLNWDSNDGRNPNRGITVDAYNPVFDLDSDAVILAVEEQIEDSDPGDLRRESLRINENGTRYLHTNSDWDEEKIVMDNKAVSDWMNAHNVK